MVWSLIVTNKRAILLVNFMIFLTENVSNDIIDLTEGNFFIIGERTYYSDMRMGSNQSPPPKKNTGLIMVWGNGFIEFQLALFTVDFYSGQVGAFSILTDSLFNTFRLCDLVVCHRYSAWHSDFNDPNYTDCLCIALNFSNIGFLNISFSVMLIFVSVSGCLTIVLYNWFQHFIHFTIRISS